MGRCHHQVSIGTGKRSSIMIWLWPRLRTARFQREDSNRDNRMRGRRNITLRACRKTERSLIRASLSLSQIKSGYIDGAVRPGSDDRECVRLSRRRVVQVHPCSMKVSSRAVVVGHVRQQRVAQMAFAKYDDMINAFPADRPDQPFSVRILPG